LIFHSLSSQYYTPELFEADDSLPLFSRHFSFRHCHTPLRHGYAAAPLLRHCHFRQLLHIISPDAAIARPPWLALASQCFSPVTPLAID